MDIAIISYYKKDFERLVTELVENEGFTTDSNYVWIKASKDIPKDVKFDHIIIEPMSGNIYSWEDLETLKEGIPLKKEKFSDDITGI